MAVDKNKVVPIVETEIYSTGKKESDALLKEEKKELENNINEVLPTNKSREMQIATDKKENEEIINTLVSDALKLIQNIAD